MIGCGGLNASLVAFPEVSIISYLPEKWDCCKHWLYWLAKEMNLIYKRFAEVLLRIYLRLLVSYCREWKTIVCYEMGYTNDKQNSITSFPNH